MARKSKGGGSRPDKPQAAEQFRIPPELVDHILLGPADDRRVLQDSPVLGDVWLAYAEDPGKPRDLLITPHRETTAAEVAACISMRLSSVRKAKERVGDEAMPRAKIAYLQGIVAARLTFDELLQVLVPLTQWWVQRAARLLDEAEPDDALARLRKVLDPARFRTATVEAAGESASEGSFKVARAEEFTALDRYVALAGLILWVSSRFERPKDGKIRSLASVNDVFKEYKGREAEIFQGVYSLYHRIVDSDGTVKMEAAKPDDGESDGDRRAKIFQISLNRRASAALGKSIPAVKADAARTLFDIKCNKIVWAVLDSGIDCGHPAFNEQREKRDPLCRVRKSLDFSQVREIISSDNQDIEPERLDELADRARLDKAEVLKRLKVIADDANAQRPINWGVVEGLIALSDPVPPPLSPHGTHVAGIIGANGDDANPGGMCRDIRLYDLRVLGRTLEDTEFAIIAALQYIRYVNERHGSIMIHGANLSLSIPHNVRNYACGRTPVCIECERLVDNGVVVVAAAGNRGHQKFQTNDGIFESYAAFSVTDPGNGEGVITVGATHGNWPHTYGISFFSSRGPTGDGRLKPDLVAPGERVQSTVLDNQWGQESGTSMAAPHVSGAAAMLLARYPELIGQPRRVKRILCETATDLGRERSFQGRGMLDVLRALQSV